MEPLDTYVAISTPERVSFRHRVAGPAPRALALLADLAIQAVVLVLVIAAAILFGLVGGSDLGGAALGVVLLAVFVVSWFYAALFEALWEGRTPGKALLRLRVVREDGSRIGAPEAVLRNLLRAADSLPVGYVIGALVMGSTPSFKRLGDWVAGTLVVTEDPVLPPDALVLDPPISEAERQSLPVGVQLSRNEVRLIEDLMRRGPRLGPDRTGELAEIIAPALSRRTGVEGANALRVLQLAWARATGRDHA